MKDNSEEMARKMIRKQKYDMKEIKDLTGLTKKQLEKLNKELFNKKNN